MVAISRRIVDMALKDKLLQKKVRQVDQEVE